MGSTISRQNAKSSYFMFKNTVHITLQPMSVQVKITGTVLSARKNKNICLNTCLFFTKTTSKGNRRLVWDT